MKKFSIKLLLALIIISNLSIPTSFAAFTDLSDTNLNFEAISYLEEQGILNGYPDGSFKPDQEVNRAEFLKIILEGSNIYLDVYFPTPFKDVDHTAWYAPYIKKAYEEGWINGYADGTFKPDQTINKVEALKILGQVQKWELPTQLSQPYSDTPQTEWYTPYVIYAKERNFLEEAGWNFFPSAMMTRAKISEIIYRTLIYEEPENTTNEEPSNTVATEEPPPTTSTPPTSTQDFTPVNFELISKNFYENITLDEQIPNIFYQDEVYFIEGTLSSSSYTQATVILDSESNSSKLSFSENAKNNHFSIPIYFSTPGNYILGLIPGDNGSSKAIKISVLEKLPQAALSKTSSTSINNEQIYFSNDHTYISFSTAQNTIKKISFTQNNNSVTYLSRQNKENIPVNYGDFQDFKEGSITYSIAVADTSSTSPLAINTAFKNNSSKNFSASQHDFSSIEEDQISATPPEVLSSIQTISFSGTALTDIKQDAYVINPDGFVEDVVLSTNSTTSTYLNKTLINENGTFTYSYTPSISGTYIVEINNKNGEPSLNHAVYVKTGTPLIPDFFDTLERTSFKGTLNLSNARNELLNLINDARREHGLNTIVLNSELNDLAQAHSQDMADNNFFGHVNLLGQTPEDRRIAAGIKTSVGENLATDTSVAAAHYGLMRSASHRNNILTEDWERVGLGIVNKDGQLYFTEEFSILELSASKIEDLETELFDKINNKRSSSALTQLTDSSIIKSASKDINDKIIIEGKTLNNDLFTETLGQNSIGGSSELIGRISGGGSWSTVLNSIVNDESSIIQATWQFIGINIQVDSIGDLHTILILNKP